jgi:hypothetical protein
MDVRDAGLGLIDAVVKVFLHRLPGVALVRDGIDRDLAEVSGSDQVVERLRCTLFIEGVLVDAFTQGV